MFWDPFGVLRSEKNKNKFPRPGKNPEDAFDVCPGFNSAREQNVELSNVLRIKNGSCTNGIKIPDLSGIQMV